MRECVHSRQNRQLFHISSISLPFVLALFFQSSLSTTSESDLQSGKSRGGLESSLVRVGSDSSSLYVNDPFARALTSLWQQKKERKQMRNQFPNFETGILDLQDMKSEKGGFKCQGVSEF